MSGDPIDPENIPQFTGDLEELGTDHLLLTAQAIAFRQSGSDVHNRFQGLSACYTAPEAEQLFATTAPVAAKADEFADDLEKVAAALSSYETEIQPLVTKLKNLKQRAETFRQQIAGDDDWREDDDNVQLNNDLWHDVNATTSAFWQAEITCHNTITALVGGSTLILEDGAEKRLMERGTSTYGFTADLLNQSEELPWGSTVEKERHGLDWLGHQVWEFGKGFVVDGVWGTIRGLGTLVGVDGWDAAGEAWKGLGKLATGVLITAVPVVGVAYWAMPEDKLPSYLRDSRNTVKEAGKALVAWDQWGENPARASGAVTFNVLTTVFTGGAGAAAKSGAVARTIGALGKTARLVDPMTYLGKATTFGTAKVADLFAGLRGVHAGAYDDILSGAGRVQPDGSVVRVGDDVPVIRDNVVEWPDGTRLNLDDGSVVRADGTAAPAKVELSAADRELLEQNLRHEEPALVGAGDRTGTHAAGSTAAHVGGDATGRAGGNTPASAHAGERTGARGTDTIPARDTGGNAAGGDGPSGGGNDGGAIPGQHAGTGGGRAGGDGSGGTPSGSRDPLDAEREVMRRQIERANNDPEWFKDHYRENGYRRDTTAEGGYGQAVPQLARNPFAPPKWIAASDMPPAIRERYVHPDPIPGKASDLPRTVVDDLNEQAAKRDAAVKADKAAEDALKKAEKAYAANRTDELAAARDLADKTHSPLHGEANRQSELLGEYAAERHAIPEHYEGAVRLDDGAFGNNRFDQVYRTTDGRYVVVEAKGSTTASLGTRKGHSGRLVTQGTKEYFETILNEMEKRAQRNENKGLLEQATAERTLAKELRGALKTDKVDYVLVKAKPDGAQYAGYEMKQFDLTK
ncbi:hypothetical protein [Streptomyces pilosus]|uniref:Uncharacterized protein n=1 Tax=Streptomyces pilosus TaxID=28893 RepID=A0A918BH75_9ACTN|nr:hypothetical protein [Streptomyces pilosus]GGQ65044.1 hypothetical protein GCM10010280_09490 [Streptomyces pilosus]GGV33940.1 hypothetical protein GCM10010261_02230 [Streptomyces pilosus]